MQISSRASDLSRCAPSCPNCTNPTVPAGPHSNNCTSTQHVLSSIPLAPTLSMGQQARNTKHPMTTGRVQCSDTKRDNPDILKLIQIARTSIPMVLFTNNHPICFKLIFSIFATSHRPKTYNTTNYFQQICSRRRLFAIVDQFHFNAYTCF